MASLEPLHALAVRLGVDEGPSPSPEQWQRLTLGFCLWLQGPHGPCDPPTVIEPENSKDTGDTHYALAIA